MMRQFAQRVLLSIACAGVWALAAPAWAQAPAATQNAETLKVVYHLTDGVAQARRALGNIRNHLADMPNSKIVVVANSLGLDLMLEGSKDAQGKSFEADVAALAGMGVEFRACANTLKARNLSADKLLPEIKVIASGVVEVARMQAREGFAYLKP